MNFPNMAPANSPLQHLAGMLRMKMNKQIAEPSLHHHEVANLLQLLFYQGNRKLRIGHHKGNTIRPYHIIIRADKLLLPIYPEAVGEWQSRRHKFPNNTFETAIEKDLHNHFSRIYFLRKGFLPCLNSRPNNFRNM